MKNIIITGAANGVGKAIAKLLQNENLILVDSDKLNLEQTAKELNKTYFVCDLTIVSEIKLLKDFVMNNFKNVDKLMAFITQQMGIIKVRPDQKLFIDRNLSNYKSRLDVIKKYVTKLYELSI